MKIEHQCMGDLAKRGLLFLIGALALGPAFTAQAAPEVFDDFEGYGSGMTFTSPTNGWQASGTAAYVTNSGGYVTNSVTPSNSVFLGLAVALTNSLPTPAVNRVWTDMRIRPVAGEEPPNAPTGTASFVCYFNANGYPVLATNGVWFACTNDIWGNGLLPATNGYVRISLFQDYSASNQVVFLDDRLILQDARFSGTAGSYHQLGFQNSDSNSWLDNVWIRTNAGPQSLTNDINLDGLADAAEVVVYGRAARKLYVFAGTTNLVPVFTTITNAIAAWRPRDVIHVIAGNYAGESVVVAANPSNIVFEGDAFTVASLTVASNASASFAQSVTCAGALTVSGQVAMAVSACLTSGSARVDGTVAMASNSTFYVGAAGLDVGAGGILRFATNSQLVVNSAGVNMTGAFTISSTWKTAASLPLAFADDFNLYAVGTVVTNLNFRGWYADAPSVLVTNQGIGNSPAVVIPGGSTWTNSSSATGLERGWSDFYLKPLWGLEPPNAPTNTASFAAYVNSDGFLVVAVKGGWTVCSNTVDGRSLQLDSNTFNRITICQDLSTGLFSLFVQSNLMAMALSAPTNTGGYHLLGVKNANSADQNTFVDNVLITTLLPGGLTNDLNNDGIADGYEVNAYNWLDVLSRGTVFKIR